MLSNFPVRCIVKALLLNFLIYGFLVFFFGLTIDISASPDALPGGERTGNQPGISIGSSLYKNQKVTQTKG